tara:strand:- start:177 stop:491 length:315 start_codon:yes stop_codon:yes gene_type:complete
MAKAAVAVAVMQSEATLVEMVDLEELEKKIVLQEALLQEAAAVAVELEQIDQETVDLEDLEAALPDHQDQALVAQEQVTPEAVEVVEVFNHTKTDLAVLVVQVL